MGPNAGGSGAVGGRFFYGTARVVLANLVSRSMCLSQVPGTASR